MDIYSFEGYFYLVISEAIQWVGLKYLGMSELERFEG